MKLRYTHNDDYFTYLIMQLMLAGFCLLVMVQPAVACGFRVRCIATQNCEKVCEVYQKIGTGSCLGLGRATNAYIGLTASHVVHQGRNHQVFIRGEWVPAVVLHDDPLVDLALLGFVWKDETLNTIEVSNDKSQVGDQVQAIAGQSGLATGVVKSFGTISDHIPVTTAYFDHKIVHGDSGAAVRNSRKELVGVLNWSNGRSAHFVNADVVYQWIVSKWGGIPSGVRQTVSPQPTPAQVVPSSPVEPTPNSPEPELTVSPAVTERSDWWKEVTIKLLSYAATTAGVGVLSGTGTGAVLSAVWFLYERRKRNKAGRSGHAHAPRPPTDSLPPPIVPSHECPHCADYKRQLSDMQQQVVYAQTPPDHGLLRMRRALKQTADTYPGLRNWLPLIEKTYSLILAGEKQT